MSGDLLAGRRTERPVAQLGGTGEVGVAPRAVLGAEPELLEGIGEEMAGLGVGVVGEHEVLGCSGRWCRGRFAHVSLLGSNTVDAAPGAVAQASSFAFCCSNSVSVITPCACSADSFDSSSAVLGAPAVVRM